ncbi:MAG: isopeptide-forming domain-containing fimbrial protein, partial [Pseudomonadota bacterium]|nr:isopeptide-forming domain-containing fimbrial protein [Pseudomonadota bacterium]
MYALLKTFRKLAMAIAPSSEAVKKQGSLAALVLVMALAAPQLHAQVNKLTATVKYDGTPGFDAIDSAGYDSSATNNRVRTHDLFGYEVGISTNASGADSNIRIKAKLPDASKARWRNVPAACNAGSQVSSDRTELTCVIAAIGADTARNVIFDGVVAGTAPNGAKIEPTFTLESNGNGTTVLNPAPLPAGQSRELTVSAAPFYDVVVQMSHDGNPNAFGMRLANGPAGEDGVFHKPLVGLVARHPNGWGNKGVEQLSDVPGKQPVIRVDFSGYPSGTLLDNWHNGTAPHGVPAATGGFAQGCGSPYMGSPSAESGGAFNMYKRVNDRGEPLAPGALYYANTVANGGTCHIQSYAGTEVAIRLEGVDTTLSRHISKVGGGSDVPAAEWWVANKGLVLWTPVNTTNYPADTLIPHKIKLLGYTGKSISDQDILGNRTDNDEATHNVINTLGGKVSKAYSPDSKIEGGGSDRLDPPYGTVRDPSWTSDQIVSYLAMGQSVSARVIYSTSEAFAPHRNVFTCEIIDRTAFDIQLGAGTAERPVFKVGTVKRGTEGGSEPTIRYGSRNAGPYFSDTSSSNSPYSDGSPTGSSYDDDDCDHAGITWHTTPEAAEAAGGLVYVRADYDMIPPGAVRYVYVRGLILRDKWAASIAVNNGTQDTRSAGQPIYNPLTHDPDVLNKRVIIRNRAKGYNPDPKASHINNARPRDHLEVIPSKTQSSVKKTVKRGTQDLKDNDDVGLGDELTYTLKPRYHTDYPRIQGTYVVEDRLPPHLEFVAGSEAVSGLQPNVNVAFTHGPDPVNAGFTILKWVFTGSGVKAALGAANPLADFATITFNARVSISAPDGAVLRNNVLAGDEVNDYGPKCSFNATVPRYQQMVGGSATDCDKASNVQLKVKVLSSYAVEKTASPAVIRPGDSFKYTIAYQAGSVPAVAPGIPHWIDVLPYSGDGSRGRSPATSIANVGAYKLQAVTNLSTTADPGMQIYLTKDAPASISGDPRDSGNSLADGSVNPARWCLMGSCAFPIAETTAIRIAPGVNTMPVGVQYKVEMTLTTDASKVDPADYYANSVTGHPPASTLNLHLVSSLGNVGVKVISNSLSGKVYWKQTVAGVEQAGEYPIANNEVKLVGCAAGPDGVVNTTAAASGP